MDRNDDSNTTTATAASVPVKPMAPMASSSSLPFSPTKRPASPTNPSQADLPEPEAKKQKVTENFRCDVCTVDCNSESRYESHIIGKKHHKQMKMFPKVSSNAIKMQQGSSPTDLLELKAENERITATFRCDVCSVDCESKSGYELHMSSLGKKHDIMTATFGCDVCLVDCKEFYSYKVHISGKNHQKKMNMSPQVSPKSIQISQDSSPTVVLEPKAENEEITAAFRCDVCSVDCDDKSGYEFHMLGKKHHIMTATFRCVICLVECLTKSSYDSHLLGRKHHNNMQTFRCNICSVNCGDKSGYEFHMLGKKHRIMTSGCQGQADNVKK